MVAGGLTIKATSGEEEGKIRGKAGLFSEREGVALRGKGRLQNHKIEKINGELEGRSPRGLSGTGRRIYARELPQSIRIKNRKKILAGGSIKPEKKRFGGGEEKETRKKEEGGCSTRNTLLKSLLR